MYYIVYGLLYLFSLLPFFILYCISDFAFLIIYHLVGYRKKVVLGNLAIAFPEKPEAERIKIAKASYKNFTDTFIESIKLISLSDKEFDKRCKGDFSSINAVAARGRNIFFMGAHQFNWEYINLVVSRHTSIPFIGIVADVEKAIIDRIFFMIRARYGAILIRKSSFKNGMAEWLKKQYCMGLLADQNAPIHKAYWLNFFGKPVPFVAGPHKNAVKSHSAVIYFEFKKIKRGYYGFEVREIIEDASFYTPEQLSLKYRDFVESIIKSQPSNYLWTHRRWKHSYDESFSSQWIEDGSRIN